MILDGIEINKISDYIFEIPKQKNMLVPGRVYLTLEMLKSSFAKNDSLKQIINVAHLPGIQKYSLAMPDIHWGYGFPIGGVAAMDFETGVISPGGVGYDINCGVRLAATSLNLKEIKESIPMIINALFQTIPSGIGSEGAIKKLSEKELKNVALNGSYWALNNGYAVDSDIEMTEEKGCLKSASTDFISKKAFERGFNQLGTLGSGNHFLEIGFIQEIYDEKSAFALGLFKEQIVFLLHTGSRGFGYQICDDSIKKLSKTVSKFGFVLPDKQLVAAPVKSTEGQEYFAAMSAAANFAWCNRQIIMNLAQKTLSATLKRNLSENDFKLIYDVSHNIAKIEDHFIDGKKRKLCIHRKGATRAFAPNSSELPNSYKKIGQPVLIPGDMGRYSFICLGTNKAMEETFGSSCHGAGRLKSRNQAIEASKGRNIFEELKKQGIYLQAKGKNTIGEEMSDAYKDVKDVVDVMHNSGIINKVARIKPLGVIKG